MAIPYVVISTVAQRNGEIYSGMNVLLMFGQGFINGGRDKDDTRDAAACRKLCEISPLRTGSADHSPFRL